MEKPTTFPESLIWDMKYYFGDLENGYLEGISSVVIRPLRPGDENRSIGLIADSQDPGGWEMGSMEPLINTYFVQIMALVKNLSEEAGLIEHGILARDIRRLVNSRDLRDLLSVNTDNFDGSIERVQMIRYRGQKYNANEIGTESKLHLFLSTTSLAIETERLK
jgi:hypothetical protein